MRAATEEGKPSEGRRRCRAFGVGEGGERVKGRGGCRVDKITVCRWLTDAQKYLTTYNVRRAHIKKGAVFEKRHFSSFYYTYYLFWLLFFFSSPFGCKSCVDTKADRLSRARTIGRKESGINENDNRCSTTTSFAGRSFGVRRQH